MAELVRTFGEQQDSEERERLHRALGEMLINISNKYFESRDIYLDGYRFINCSFNNSRLITNRGTFELHNCRVVNCSRHVNEEAQKVLQFGLLGVRKLDDQDIHPGLQVVVNPDGTISIAKGVSC